MEPIDQDTGIILLAFGGPNSLEEVEPFLKNIFPNSKLSPAFQEEIKERYRLIGGKSPLLDITIRQACLLQTNLQRKGKPLAVFVGMRFWRPFIPETIKIMVERGIKRIFCLILSPFITSATAEGYWKIVNQSIKDISSLVEVQFIPSWNHHLLYLKAVKEKIEEALNRFPVATQHLVPLIFSVHSLPLRYVKEDPYVAEIRKTVRELMSFLKKNKEWYLAFQSSGKGEWLSPSVEEVLVQLEENGKKEVLIVPLGFVSDHLETLYDLDIALKKKAEERGINLQRAAALNDTPEFIEALSQVIIDFIGFSKT